MRTSVPLGNTQPLRALPGRDAPRGQNALNLRETAQGRPGSPQLRKRPRSTQFRLTECINQTVFESQHSHKIVKLFSTLTILNNKGRFYVLVQIAEFAIGKSIIDFHTILIRANREEIAPFQH